MGADAGCEAKTRMRDGRPLRCQLPDGHQGNHFRQVASGPPVSGHRPCHVYEWTDDGWQAFSEVLDPSDKPACMTNHEWADALESAEADA